MTRGEVAKGKWANILVSRTEFVLRYIVSLQVLYQFGLNFS